jgi:hypothetical protein
VICGSQSSAVGALKVAEGRRTAFGNIGFLETEQFGFDTERHSMKRAKQTEKNWILLVGCSGKKQKIAPGAMVRADSLYQSELFLKRMRFAQVRNARWFILSAKSLLLKPESYSRFYEKQLKDFSRIEFAEWHAQCASEIVSAVAEEFPGLKTFNEVGIEIHAGRLYREPLASILMELGAEVSIPVAGLPIGKQLQWYQQQIQCLTLANV